MNWFRPSHLPQQLATTLPLLTRELIEQSARKRTFILRTIYAACLYGFVVWGFWNEMGSWSTQSFSFLGQGRQLFDTIAWIQFCGLYLFLPAMTSGVLTVEKERDTLSLLLLTRLGPWSILLGKLLSRMVPMASYLLLATPLLAVAYSLGGVETGDIVSLAWALFVTSLQVGALSLACSAWCRTTAAAFLLTYLVGFALFLGPPFLYASGFGFFGIVDAIGEWASSMNLIAFHQQVALMLFGPSLCVGFGQGRSIGLTILLSTPILVFTGTCLIFARVVLWRRAFLRSSDMLLKLFKSLDKLFHQMNQNTVTKGIVLIHENVTLPDYEPIRWRETKKRSLGTTRYLVRLLLVLEVPVWIGMLIPMETNSMTPLWYSAPYVTAWVLWVAATLVIVVQATGLIGLEKSRQTLDVLLTIPMSSDKIVQEKFAGIWRLIKMLWIPFATIYVFQLWWATWAFNRPFDEHAAFALMRGILATAVYPPLIASLGFHFGLRCRSQTQAVLVTLSAIGAMCAIPPILAEVFRDPVTRALSPAESLRWLSPAIAVSATSQDLDPWSGPPQRDAAYAFLGLLTHFAIYATVLIALWSRSLKTFAQYVGRNDGQIVDDDDIERLALLRQRIVGSGVYRTRTDDE